MMTSRMAFSCTCQPNRKEEYAVRVKAPRNVVAVGLVKSLSSAGYRRVSGLRNDRGGTRGLTI